jgi:hypothetical protein
VYSIICCSCDAVNVGATTGNKIDVALKEEVVALPLEKELGAIPIREAA